MLYICGIIAREMHIRIFMRVSKFTRVRAVFLVCSVLTGPVDTRGQMSNLEHANVRCYFGKKIATAKHLWR